MFYKLDVNGNIQGQAIGNQGEGWQELPDAPDRLHRWDGTGWILDSTLVSKKEKEDAEKRLGEIDIQSIAYIREYIAGKVDCPKGLLVLETEAKVCKDRANK